MGQMIRGELPWTMGFLADVWQGFTPLPGVEYHNPEPLSLSDPVGSTDSGGTAGQPVLPTGSGSGFAVLLAIVLAFVILEWWT
jgi:hypothetical protein